MSRVGYESMVYKHWATTESMTEYKKNDTLYDETIHSDARAPR
jgi:hypothetical protein